jgi:hypothetical protein
VPLISLDIPPGVYRNGTTFQSQGRWFEASLMRWYQSTLRPFGGWQVLESGMAGPGRGILTWRAANFVTSALVGTPSNLYVWDGDVLTDITPAGFPEGLPDSIPGVGYGFGPFGGGPFGAPNPDVDFEEAGAAATSWSMDNWGDEALVIATHEGTLRQYANDAAEPAPVANAPSGSFVFVTAERVAVMLGTNGDRRALSWSDFENNTTWIPDANNAAGDWRFQTKGTLVAGARVRSGNLIWTTTDVTRMDFIGGTLVYRFDLLADNCGLIGPRAFQVVDDGAVWMGRTNFYSYAGGRVQPLASDVHDYVFTDINMSQAAKFHCGKVSTFGEVLFFYCSADSTAINRCVSVNVREGHWNIVDPAGVMARGCWADADAFPFPLAADLDGNLLEHERVLDVDDAERYALSGPIQMGQGDRMLEAVQMLPDEESTGAASLFFAQQFTPQGPVYNRGPYPTAHYTDLRLTGRQIAMKITAPHGDFRFGAPRLEVFSGSRR